VRRSRPGACPWLKKTAEPQAERTNLERQTASPALPILTSMIKYEFGVETRAMAEIERLTVTLPAEMTAVIKSAVETGDYASTSEVVREAVRDWKTKRALQLQELTALKADIEKGLAEVAAGRVKKFDTARIIERGKNY
jgi:antitoxin ParD1/3/4